MIRRREIKKMKRVLMGIVALCMSLSFGCMGFMPPMMQSSSSSSSSISSSSSEESSVESSEESSVESSEESSVESSVESSEESSVESSVESASSEEEHQHVFGETWKTTSTYHWLVCECGEKSDLSKHVGEATSCVEKPTCDVCGVQFGKPADHKYGALTDIGEGVKGFACEGEGCSLSMPLLSEEKDGEFVEGVVDFAVEVEEGRDPVVLQLSDTQFMSKADAETKCYRYIRETVEASKPDLILITGDVVYGKFDPDGSILLDFIAFMESLQIPWAPVFGNHDNECELGVDWQCEQFEKAEYCLFEQRDLKGNGNYSVGIVQGGEILRTFYMLDSNGCGAPSTASRNGKNGIQTSAGFASSQVAWYKDSIATLKMVEPDVKITLAFHIQPVSFRYAFEKYEEYNGLLKGDSNSVLEKPLNLDTLATAEEGDFGYLGRTMKGPWGSGNREMVEWKELGVDSVLVGHEHCNSISIVYNGIRFQYGQKSSTYDRYNVLLADGTITDNNSGSGEALMGGTVMPISQEDGSFVNPYIYLYGDPMGLNP